MAKSTRKYAKHLKRLRELAGLSQYVVSRGTGTDRSRLSSIENGYVWPRRYEIVKIERFVAHAQERRAVRLTNMLLLTCKSTGCLR
jgi:transcriptional regulator with XRE-family HTH domain